MFIGATGAGVAYFVNLFCNWKLNIVYNLMAVNNIAGAFFAYQFVSLFLGLCSGICCIWQNGAAGSGIPEIIAFLNGMMVMYEL